MIGDRWQIKKCQSLPLARLQALIQESEQAGYRFLRRLSDEWRSGANRFDKPSEALFIVADGEEVLGICGINRDVYQPEPRVARLRHMYVASSVRRNGLGSRLLAEVVEHVRSSGEFDRVRLRTDTLAAARFYEGRGFHRCLGEAFVTHELHI